VSGLGLGAGLDVRAYDNCLARHPQDTLVCEGPRQAYEVGPTIVQARSTTTRSPAGYDYEEGLALNPPMTPVQLRPGPMPVISGPNG
jgi:hypothetical protein